MEAIAVRGQRGGAAALTQHIRHMHVISMLLFRGKRRVQRSSLSLSYHRTADADGLRTRCGNRLRLALEAEGGGELREGW